MARRNQAAMTPVDGNHVGSPTRQPAPGRPWFKKKRFAIPLALLLLVIIGSQLGGQGDGETPAAEVTAQSDATSGQVADAASAGGAAATMGTPVRDGKFEFTVSKMTCGVSKVGNEYLNETAQGQFCIVDLTAKNIGDEPQTFMSDNQEAFIGEVKYSSSSAAAIYYASEQGRSGGDWIKEINPGNQLRGSLVFDVPKGKKPERLMLHDSAFSGGVAVAVK